MKRLALLGLALTACFDFEAAQKKYCEANPKQCGDGGMAGGSVGGGAAGGDATGGGNPTGGGGGATGGGSAGGGATGGGATGGGSATGGGATGGGSTGGGSTGGGSAGGSVTPIMNTSAPSITGFPQVDQLFVADAGTWTGPSIVFTYAWVVTAPDGGTRIAIDGGLTFSPITADIGSSVALHVTATNGAGPVLVQSTPLGPIRLRPHPEFVTGWEQATNVPLDDFGSPTSAITAMAETTMAERRTGRSSLVCNPAAGDSAYWQLNPSAAPVAVVRFAMNIGMNTDGTMVSPVAAIGLPVDKLELQFDNSRLRLASNGSVTGTVPFSRDMWHLVDVRVDARAMPWQVDWAIDGQPQNGLTITSPPSNVTYIQLGRPATGTTRQLRAIYDDFAWSTQPGDFPMGDGRVEAIPLVRAGNHHQPASFRCVVGGNMGPCDGGSFATELDDWPNLGTTWVEQMSASDGGAYLEHFLADSGVHPAPAPNAVHFLISVQANQSEAVPGFSPTTYLMPSVGTGTAWFSFTDNLGPGRAGTWKTGELNATPVRLGFLSVPSPARVHAILVEADFSK